MNKERKLFIKLTVLKLLQSYGDIFLPIPIKKITKSLDNCRLIPFSKFMKDNNLSYPEMIKFAETEDACTDYYPSINKYIIYYNDKDPSRMNSDRYRWNIAHELGHILLNHHKDNNKTRIFRNTLNAKEYSVFEDEADTFAAYLLVPHVMLSYYGVQNAHDIANKCRISMAAAKNRLLYYNYWKKYYQSNDKYDVELRKLLYSSPSNQSYIFCSNCGVHVGYNNIKKCRICGNSKAKFKLEATDVTYSKIEVDEHSKAIECPICGNNEVSKGDYCKICGTYLVNKCTSNNPDFKAKPVSCSESENNPLPGDARYCMYCGSKTTFLYNKLLTEWDNDDSLPF